MITIVTTLLLFGIWIQRLGDLSVALGILAAGLAFALQEVIGSVAGWTTIITGKPFSIGDRIETGGIRGDVADIGVLRTTLMEIGSVVTTTPDELLQYPMRLYSKNPSTTTQHTYVLFGTK